MTTCAHSKPDGLATIPEMTPERQEWLNGLQSRQNPTPIKRIPTTTKE